MLPLKILLRCLTICVSAWYFYRVLKPRISFCRTLLCIGLVLAVFQTAYFLWPESDLFSSDANALLSVGVLLLAAVVCILTLRAITRRRISEILLFYSLWLLIAVASSLLLFTLSAAFGGERVSTVAAREWNDFFSAFIAAVLQMGLMIAVSEAVSHYVERQTVELRFSQFMPVLGAEAASAVILLVFMRESDQYRRMLPALAVLLLLYAIADGVLFSAFRAFVKNSELTHEVELLQQMQRLQKEYYQSLHTQMQDMRHLRHDYQNVLQTLDLLIEEGEAEKARGFAAECSASLTGNGTIAATGNDILDAVLYAKATEANGLGVSFTAELVLPEPMRIADTDVMAVFANLLDNALEYTAKLPDGGERQVGVTGAVRAGLWVLTFANTYLEAEPPTFETTKTDRAQHGYGMSIVRGVVQKYNGTLSAAVADGRLSITVTLNSALENCNR